jgi:hypothetical protein
MQLGVDQDLAYAWSRTRKGGWAIAQSPILGTTITLMALKRPGYELSARLLLGNHSCFMSRRIRARDEMSQWTFYQRAARSGRTYCLSRSFREWCERAEAAETSVASLCLIGSWLNLSFQIYVRSISFCYQVGKQKSIHYTVLLLC